MIFTSLSLELRFLSSDGFKSVSSGSQGETEHERQLLNNELKLQSPVKLRGATDLADS